MKKVFEAVQLGNLSLKNRLVRSTTWEGIARPDGIVTEEAFANSCTKKERRILRLSRSPARRLLAIPNL